MGGDVGLESVAAAEGATETKADESGREAAALEYLRRWLAGEEDSLAAWLEGGVSSPEMENVYRRLRESELRLEEEEREIREWRAEIEVLRRQLQSIGGPFSPGDDLS